MHPFARFSRFSRRSLAALVAVFAMLLLAACVSTPQKSAYQRQTEALTQLGFHETPERDWMLALPERISFTFDSDRLKPGLVPGIGRVAHQLLEVDIQRLRVEGHSDNQGPAEYNLSLSQRRAEAVARVLEDNGYAAGDVTREGMGSAHPAASNNTLGGRAENRRVEIIVQADSLAGP